MQYLLILLFSLNLFASPDQLHKSPKWIKLLHYKPTMWGGLESEADGKDFFLHKDGKTNPRLELEESIKRFGETESPKDGHPICQFPLRYKYLNQALGNPWKANFSGCTKYIEFFSKLAAKRASIIFSSYYLTNPNSAFGHTLLRLSRYDDKNETEMLDYGINYSAEAKENNPLLYALKGLFGGFQGKFAAIPYYYKIREYSNFEFRDLWSYDLKLSMIEVLEMVDHIWELGHTYFDYYYFHENCSYHILSVLEVARPTLKLTDNYHVFTIPADTIRLLHKEGLLDDGKRRESTYSKLVRLSEDLTNEELRIAKSISKKPEMAKELVAGINDQKASKILDVAIEAFDYANFEKVLLDDPKTKEIKENILIARAVNPVITHDEGDKRAKFESPALSHSPIRIGLSEGYLDQTGKRTNFEFRSSLHDMLDPPRGSLKEAQLEVGKISFSLIDRFYRDPGIALQNLTIFSIKNYPEQNFWTSPLSWEIEVGAKELPQYTCFDCPAVFLNGSIGNSLNLGHQKFLVSLLMNMEVDFQSMFVNNYLVGMGPKLYMRYRFTDKWVGSLSSLYHFNTYEHNKIFQDHTFTNELEVRTHLSEKVSLFSKGGFLGRETIYRPYGELGLQYFYE